MPLVQDSIPVVSAYRKVRCVAFISTALNAKKCVAEVVINGSVVATLVYDLALTGSFQYSAEIDAATIVQDFLGPDQSDTAITSSLGPLAVPYEALSTDLYCVVDFNVSYFYEDATTGKLVDFGIVETLTSPIEVFAATTQHLDDINLTPFLPLLASGANRLLTNSPKTIDICPKDSYYFSCLVTSGLFAGHNSVRVRTYNSAGALIDQGRFDLFPLFTGGLEVASFAVGYANLVTQVWDEGSVTITNPNVAYYLVDVGAGTLAGWIDGSETFRFDVVTCCESYKVRLEFMNNKSGFDSITFQYTQLETPKSSTTIQRPLPYGQPPLALTEPLHLSTFKGKYPVNIQSQTNYNLSYTVKSQDQIQQLIDLVVSPEIYAEIGEGGARQPVIILDSTPVHDIKDDLATFEITIQLGNDTITIRN